VDGFVGHGFLVILKDVFGGLLQEDMILPLPSVVDIVIAVDGCHFAEG